MSTVNGFTVMIRITRMARMTGITGITRMKRDKSATNGRSLPESPS